MSTQKVHSAIIPKTKLRTFAWYTFVPPLLSLCLPPPFAFCRLDGDTWAVWSQRCCSCVCFLNNCSLLLDCYHFHSTYLNLHIGHVFQLLLWHLRSSWNKAWHFDQRVCIWRQKDFFANNDHATPCLLPPSPLHQILPWVQTLCKVFLKIVEKL